MSESSKEKFEFEASISEQVFKTLKLINLREASLKSLEVFISLKENDAFDKPLYIHISSQELKKPFEEC